MWEPNTDNGNPTTQTLFHSAQALSPTSMLLLGLTIFGCVRYAYATSRQAFVLTYKFQRVWAWLMVRQRRIVHIGWSSLATRRSQKIAWQSFFFFSVCSTAVRVGISLAAPLPFPSDCNCFHTSKSGLGRIVARILVPRTISLPI